MKIELTETAQKSLKVLIQERIKTLEFISQAMVEVVHHLDWLWMS